MRIEWLISPLAVSIALTAATAEPLEKRFGPERERGYRAERGLSAARPGFVGNFLEPLHRPMTLRVAPDGDRPAGGLSSESVGPVSQTGRRVSARRLQIGPPSWSAGGTTARRRLPAERRKARRSGPF